jgi:type II secretory pathway component PulF
MARHRRRLTFYQGLHVMLRSGLSLNLAFTELSRGEAKDPFRRAVAEVGKGIGAGAGLAQAMRRHPTWFEPWVVEAVEGAEVSGTLEQGLARIIEWMEELQRLRLRTLSLCAYPAYLLVAFIVGGALLEGSASVIRSGSRAVLGDELTAALVRRIFQVSATGLAIAGAPLAVAALGFEEHWARLRMEIPLLGGFHQKLQASRFCQVLGSSVGAGLEVARSLRMAIAATQNPELRTREGHTLQQLQDGATLTDAMAELGVLDGESLRRIAIGERTGTLEANLRQLAREHSEAGIRRLQTVVFVLIAALAVILFASSIGSIFQIQGDYFRRVEELSHG